MSEKQPQLMANNAKIREKIDVSGSSRYWKKWAMQIEKIFNREISPFDGDGNFIKLNYSCPFCQLDSVFADEITKEKAKEDNYAECLECGCVIKLDSKNKDVKVGTKVFIHW